MIKRIVGAVLFVAVLAALIALGIWQVQRLHWKEGVLADIDARIAGEAGPLPEAFDREADRYRPVTVTGVMGEEEIHVLVSSRDYGAGFRIIAPFVTEDGKRILIDRGFVIDELRDTPRVTGPMTITGNLHWPDERTGSTPEDDIVGNWWFARDVDKMAEHLGTDPVMIIAREQNDAQVLPMPVTSADIPNDHLWYAAQWFLFAAIWVLMTGFALWRIRRRNE